MKKTKHEDSIGSRLRKARLKLDLTLDKVYKDLKIPPRILEALENDNIDPNMGEIYIKGFLKKYARYLGIEDDKILSEFAAKSVFEEPKKGGLIDIGREIRPPLIDKDRFKKSILPIISILALIFTISIITYTGYRLVGELSTIFTKQKKIKPENLPLIIPEGQPLVLKVETKDEVWLRVKSDGKLTFEHILPKGSIESWNAKDGFELWVGRAEALDLTLNGKRLGSPGRGRIRKIIIDRTGLKIEKK